MFTCQGKKRIRPLHGGDGAKSERMRKIPVAYKNIFTIYLVKYSNESTGKTLLNLKAIFPDNPFVGRGRPRVHPFRNFIVDKKRWSSRICSWKRRHEKDIAGRHTLCPQRMWKKSYQPTVSVFQRFLSSDVMGMWGYVGMFDIFCWKWYVLHNIIYNNKYFLIINVIFI